MHVVQRYGRKTNTRISKLVCENKLAEET